VRIQRSESESQSHFEYSQKTPSRILLWNERGDRRQMIGEIIRDAGANSVVLEALSDLRGVKLCRQCFVAVVGADSQSDDVCIEVIRALKADGFEVIACADTHGWQLKGKCRLLLAGAVRLLDNSSPKFSDELREAVTRSICTEAQRNSEESRIRRIMHELGMVGNSPKLMTVFRSVIRFSALSDLPVLITGDTGTGKEGLARALHSLDSKRSAGPFVALNCGAINAALAESEFFGHRRGAFTGSERGRKGVIRAAEGGVLFLDEIAEMDLALQTRLLRVLQENRVRGLGEDREVEVSVRVIAATNRDLEQMVHRNLFRSDLFHRLNVLSIQVAPLRERPDDIAPLVEHFLQKYRSLSAGLPSASIDFLEALRHLDFPGNVRELENLVRQALVDKTSDLPLCLGDLPVEILRQFLIPEETGEARKLENLQLPNSETLTSFFIRMLELNDWNLRRSLENCERQALEAAVKRTRGNQSQVARLLGITPRSVYNKVRKYKLKYADRLGLQGF
jgi:two-component system response regulator PilR (NtrC family)